MHTLTPAEREKGARAGGAAIAKRAAQRRADQHQIWRFENAIAREDVPVSTLALFAALLDRLAADGALPPVASTLDVVRYVDVMEKLHRIMRLESGESTSNVLTVAVDPMAMMRRLEVLAATQPGAVDVDSVVNEDTTDVPATDIPEA